MTPEQKKLFMDMFGQANIENWGGANIATNEEVITEALKRAYNKGVDDALNNITYIYSDIYDGMYAVDKHKINDLKIK